MKIVTKQIYTDEDKELLKHILPDNPCSQCPLHTACCGCPEQRHYDEVVRPYKDNDIYDIALQLKNISDLRKQIQKCEEAIKEEIKTLPDFLKCVK